MPSPTRFTGTVASRGFAEGPLVPLGGGTVAPYASSGSAAEEAARLEAALRTAVEQLGTLRDAATGADAADMLEFQLAMLDDESLAEPASEEIAAGVDAATAWAAALDAEVAGYETAEDDYFQARAADLRDIRDRVLRVLSGAVEARSVPGGILAGDDITPSQFLAVDWSRGGGIALRRGSAASHVAMLARARGVPMLVGASDLPELPAALALLDAESGVVVLDPGAEDRAGFDALRSAATERRSAAGALLGRPASTADGTPVAVSANIAEPDEVESLDIGHVDGVGLMRTEFLYSSGLPDEETQYAAYRRVLEWAAGKPVVIRTVDAGGDKPVPGFTVAETNPFLGLRGIRLALARPDVFRVQIRALLRAAVHGELRVMFPMISIPAEYERAAALFAEEAAGLAATGVVHRMPPLGIMVEVPSVAIAPEGFADVAFFSIGSNDLTQYVMAAGRDNGAVAALNDVGNPAVLALIGRVVAFGAGHGIPVSLCGDAGGDPSALPLLLATGLRSVSVAPAQLALAKLAISRVELGR